MRVLGCAQCLHRDNVLPIDAHERRQASVDCQVSVGRNSSAPEWGLISQPPHALKLPLPPRLEYGRTGSAPSLPATQLRACEPLRADEVEERRVGVERGPVEGDRCSVEPEAECARSLSFEAARHRLTLLWEEKRAKDNQEEVRVRSWRGSRAAIALSSCGSSLDGL